LLPLIRPQARISGASKRLRSSGAQDRGRDGGLKSRGGRSPLRIGAGALHTRARIISGRGNGMNDPQTVYFEESQRFPAWVGALLLVSVVIAGLGALAAVGPGQWVAVLIAGAAGLALASLLLGALTLKTVVTDAGVRVKGLLFINRLIAFADIESAAARRYDPIMEYGGWGYRIGRSGKAYNAQGDEGVQLALKDGGRVLIGSARANELAAQISAQLKM
jgi:hypothetical protein